jgi:hypothetical protein
MQKFVLSSSVLYNFHGQHPDDVEEILYEEVTMKKGTKLWSNSSRMCPLTFSKPAIVNLSLLLIY